MQRALFYVLAATQSGEHVGSGLAREEGDGGRGKRERRRRRRKKKVYSEEEEVLLTADNK